MAHRIDIQPLVYLDLAEISEYIARDRPASAHRFLFAADETFAWLAKHPKVGMRCEFENPLAADVRCWRVKGFKNYLIFYRRITRGIQVIRILHGARDIAALFEDPRNSG
jgi:toxin ParE1/3/4